MRLILSEWLIFGKMWKNMEKRPFFRAAMAGLGKYRMGGHGQIGVYREAYLCGGHAGEGVSHGLKPPHDLVGL